MLWQGAFWITFAAVATETAEAFGVSTAWVNALSLSYLVFYAPGTLLAAAAARRLGLRRTVLIGAAANSLAGVLRWTAVLLLRNSTHRRSAAFALLLLGQSVAALAQPIFTNLPARVASTWFASTAEAMAAAAMSNSLGIAIGQVVPPLVVVRQGQAEEGDVTGFSPMLGAQGAVAIAGLAAAALLFGDQPKYPPTAAEGARRAAPRESIAEALAALRRDTARLLSDVPYLVLLGAFGVGLGAFNAILTLIEQWVGTAGYGSEQAGAFGGILIGGGLSATVAAAVALDKTRAYSAIVRGWFAYALLMSLGVVLVLRPGQAVLVGAAFFGLGTGFVPILTCCFEATAAHTYPVNEEVSTGLLMLTGQLTGIGFTAALTRLIELHPSYTGTVWTPVNICFLSIAVLCAALAQLFHGSDMRGRGSSDGPNERDRLLSSA